MTQLNNRIQFTAIVLAENCNPNGDPIAANFPRTDEHGMGMMSDVCIKRKIRNRMQDMGYEILNKSNDRTDDGIRSIRGRVTASEAWKKYKDSEEDFLKSARETWIDVRTFGQLFGFKHSGIAGVSISARGAVSIQHAFTIDWVHVKNVQITKSLNGEKEEGRDSETMGMKYIVEKGVYVIKGGINCNMAKKNGFTKEDSEIVKKCLLTLFDNDETASRPIGSMTVCELFWWEHDCASGSYPPLVVFNSIDILPVEDYPYYKVQHNCELDRVKCEHYDLLNV